MRVVGTIEPGVLAALAPAEAFPSLEDLLRWNHDLVEIVVQDEFTHDVVMRRDGVFLVFDTT
ncbi:MAG: hypothetical protein QM831_43410 [Kofleriaceae bacterium]